MPVYAAWFDEGFYLTLFSRVMVMAIAAISLNLLIGYTGLVSFGHALYLMVGAYAAGIASFHGITNGWLQLAIAIGAGLVISFVTGLIVLRTSGMAFIMITLAFAQMFFYLGISLKQYGGDDGLRMDARSALAPFDMSSNMTLYYVVFVILLAALYLSHSRQRTADERDRLFHHSLQAGDLHDRRHDHVGGGLPAGQPDLLRIALIWRVDGFR